MELNEKKLHVSMYKPSNIKAFTYLILPTFILVLGVAFVFSKDAYLYWLGELVLSIFFLQSFILLHECGHLSFFKTRALNVVFGHFFGLLSVIPFYSWQQMHGLHHRWTGWRDKDPTTQSTIKPSESKLKNYIINIAWTLFIPVFYLSYKISNYWNLFKIKQYLNAKKYKKVRLHIIIYLFIFMTIVLFFGDFLWKYIAPAFVLSLVWKELVIMTQHSHVEMPIANNNEVKPFSYLNQVKYTRSFYLNSFISKYFLFNFNLHEAHHAYPGLPAYKLAEVILNIPKEPTYFSWLLKAKSMKGVDYIFKTSKQTGKKF